VAHQDAFKELDSRNLDLGLILNFQVEPTEDLEEEIQNPRIKNVNNGTLFGH
jgi:hypothetical protein